MVTYFTNFTRIAGGADYTRRLQKRQPLLSSFYIDTAGCLCESGSMLNFDYCNKTRYIYGPGEHLQLGKYLKPMVSGKVLLHYGGGSIIRSGLLGRIRRSLQEIDLPEVQDFLRMFLPSFDLSLDELNGGGRA